MPATHKYVLRFLASQCPKFDCFFCGERVEAVFPFEGRVARNKTFALHHIDGDHDNRELSNLAPVHAGCHSSYHAPTGVNKPGRDRKSEWTPERRAVQSEKIKKIKSKPMGS